MKKLLVTALFGAFAMAQETTTTAAPATSHTILYQVDLDYRLDGDVYEGEHFVRYAYKFSDGYKLMPAVSFFTNQELQSNGDRDWKVTHAFARVEWETPKWWDILGFKTSWRVRYSLPTSNGAQAAGTYGTLSNRLMMEQEFNSFFNLTIIPKVNVVLNRNGYARGGGAGNPIGGVALEILPQIKFSEALTLTYDADVTTYYVHESFGGAGDEHWDTKLNHELELMYTIAAAGDLGVGLIFVNDDVDFQKEFKPFEDDATFVGVRLSKSLDL